MAKRPAVSNFEDDDTPSVALVPIGALGSTQSDQRGLTIVQARVVCATKPEFVREIARLWTETQSRFLDIGHYLIEAKEKLGHGEFLPMIDAELPFGARTAHKLMVVAEAMDTGMFPPERLPPTYTTVYELVSLKPAERDLAMRQDLVRPDVSREAVLRFKKELRGAPANAVPKSHAALRKRLNRLRDERRKLDAEINQIALALGEPMEEPTGGD